MKKIITQSQISVFRDCPKKFYWRYVEEIVPYGENTGAREYGSAIHAGLERYFLTGDPDAGMAEIAKWGVSTGTHGVEENDLLKVKALYGGYVKRWKNPQAEFEVVKVEKEFKFPIDGTDYEFRGKIDVILRDKETGRWVLMDHKTASRVDGDYILKRWMDLQLNAYAIGSLEALGIQIDDFVYDVLDKPQIRQTKKETVEEYCARLDNECMDVGRYVRQTYVKEEMRVAETRRQLAGWIGNIALADASGFYGENTSQCFNFGACPYWDLCVSGCNPVVRDNGYQKVPANPELAVEVEKEAE